VFRSVVDLILVNDFVAYVILALANFYVPPANEFGVVDVLRYLGGLALIAFNVWVKRDAHRVVKDFAWCMFGV
jgi:phosphatidylethanolamine N-methyltransferase